MANTSIWLHTNKLVDLTNLEATNFSVEDFIHPLCLINRYTGNTKKPYSVGEHSFIGSGLPIVKDQGLARAFFIHDFSEVLMNDIPSPVKSMLPEYVELEDRVQRCIFAAFDEPWENMARIHEYDKRMCADEMMQVFSVPHEIDREPLGFKVRFYHWEVCKTLMQNRARELNLV